MPEIKIADIKIPADRQRKEFTGIEELADSIERRGLIHPVVLNQDNFLVVGERRLRAYQELGRETIPFTLIEETDPMELSIIELEENVRRVDLTWQEESLAYLNLHEAYSKKDPDWDITRTSDELNFSSSFIDRRLAVARALRSKDEKVLSCEGVNAAYNVLSRQRSRKVDTEVSKFVAGLQAKRLGKPSGGLSSGGSPEETSASAKSAEPDSLIRPASKDILVKDFLKAAPKYKGAKFNFLHIDFPYGIGHDTSDQGAAGKRVSYADTEDLFWELLHCFLDNFERFVLPSAHILFWFNMEKYEQIMSEIRNWATDNYPALRVRPRPLIWHRADNVGILPDPNRGPRQVYETALIMNVGDRKICQAVSDCISVKASKRKAHHASEKPYAVVHHFLRMFVDESTVMFDPTCGSGSALRAAERLEAKSITGWDLDPESVDLARHEQTSVRMALKGDQTWAERNPYDDGE